MLPGVILWLLSVLQIGLWFCLKFLKETFFSSHLGNFSSWIVTQWAIFMLIHCSFVQIILDLESILLLYMHCWRQSVVQTSRDENLVLCFSCKTSLFWGRWPTRQEMCSPRFPCNKSAGYKENQKRSVHITVFCSGLCFWTSFNTVANVNVWFT